MPINKTEALARLTALEAEASKLRAILEAPVVAPSLLKRKEDLIDMNVYSLYRNKHTFHSLLSIEGLEKCHMGLFDGENYFESTKQANDYAQAFETFLLLRRQPGTVVPVDGKHQWIIDGNVEPDDFESMKYKLSMFSPVFDNRSDCDAAITAIGQTRLLHMFNTFHHIGA